MTTREAANILTALVRANTGIQTARDNLARARALANSAQADELIQEELSRMAATLEVPPVRMEDIDELAVVVVRGAQLVDGRWVVERWNGSRTVDG